MEFDSHAIDSLSGNLSTMFGRKKNVITTYSKNRPVQITMNNHFPTPNTPGYSSKEKSSQQEMKKKGKCFAFHCKVNKHQGIDRKSVV